MKFKKEVPIIKLRAKVAPSVEEQLDAIWDILLLLEKDYDYESLDSEKLINKMKRIKQRFKKKDKK